MASLCAEIIQRMDEFELLLEDEGEDAVKLRFPERLRHIVDLIGIRAAYALAVHFGGARIRFSEHSDFRTRIEAVIGEGNASKLRVAFGFEEVSLPRAFGLIRFVKHREILRGWENGDTAGTLARRFRLTERQVYNIVADNGAGKKH